MHQPDLPLDDLIAPSEEDNTGRLLETGFIKPHTQHEHKPALFFV